MESPGGSRRCHGDRTAPHLVHFSRRTFAVFGTADDAVFCAEGGDAKVRYKTRVLSAAMASER
jgi:hypothetical protein